MTSHLVYDPVVYTTYIHSRLPVQEHEEVVPVIRKKRGRPKGWRKPGKTLVEVLAGGTHNTKELDTIELLHQELADLRAKLRDIETGKRAEKTFGLAPQPPQPENQPFKGRPLPNPLPKGFPAVDPLSGDKTPEVVEWFRDNDPQEFEERYKGRKTHLRESLKYEKDDDEDKLGRVTITRGSDSCLNTQTVAAPEARSGTDN